jgi:hypothetical protein
MPDRLPAEDQVALARLREHLALAQAWAGCPEALAMFSAGLAVQRASQTIGETLREADAALCTLHGKGRRSRPRGRGLSLFTTQAGGLAACSCTTGTVWRGESCDSLAARMAVRQRARRPGDQAAPGKGGR